jgi:RNA-binding protein
MDGLKTMIDLTSKEKKHLRSLGQRIHAMASVGKAGMSESVIKGIQALLEQHELVKVRIPAGGGDERTATAEELASLTQSQRVALVGRMVLLYRPSEQLPDKRRIHFA